MPGRRLLARATFGRAHVSRRTLLLLVALRFYAIGGIAIAAYAFFRAVH